MSPRSRCARQAAALVCSAWLTLGCGADAAVSTARDGSTPQMRDGGAEQVLADAMAAPPEVDAGFTASVTCDLDAEPLSIPIDGRGSRTWDALQTGDTIHLAYEVPTCEDTPAAQAQSIYYRSFASTGPFEDPLAVAGAAEGECFFTRTPCLAPSSGQAPLLFYSSSALGQNELFQSQIGDMSPDVRLTLDVESSSDTEEHTVCAPYGASHLLAYVNARKGLQGAASGQIVTRRVGFAEQEVLSAARGLHIAGLSFAAFTDSKLGALLTWVADAGDEPGIVAQRLDLAGQPQGEPVLLSKQVGAFSNVSMQMLPPGTGGNFAGAIVYGIAPDDDHTELRFRTILRDGGFGKEVPITTGATNAQGIAIAPFARGYVLVYRVIAGADSSLHVRIINLEGSTAAHGERVLVGSEASGSAPKAFVTRDGRITVVFSDTSSQGSTLRVVRAICDP